MPQVVEITTTDVSAKLLKTEAPKVFKLLKANAAKITRMAADFGHLDFPANHFDVVSHRGRVSDGGAVSETSPAEFSPENILEKMGFGL